ncbi:MAG TPA: hypothetical protein VGM13_15215 [Thermoanaerobaculia bacterium]|jgi:hypothetical protein
MKRLGLTSLALLAAAASLSLAAAEPAQKGKFEKSFPFTGDKDIKIGFKYHDVTIESFRIRHWPDGDDIRKGEKDHSDTHTSWVDFTYSNRDDGHDYKCTYTVTVPGGPNGVYGKNDRTATLDKGKRDDTNKLSLRMKTHEYRLAKTIKISLEVWRK